MVAGASGKMKLGVAFSQAMVTVPPCRAWPFTAVPLPIAPDDEPPVHAAAVRAKTVAAAGTASRAGEAYACFSMHDCPFLPVT